MGFLHRSVLATTLLAAGASGCSGGAPAATADAAATVDAAAPAPPEKRCGMPDVYYSAYDAAGIARLAGCTVLVGNFQEDSVGALSDFSGLEAVRKIEGVLNVFRSPGFRTLKGFDNLEAVEGNLFIHLNDNLESLAALAKLRTITGSLYITGNPKLPQAEIDAFRARVTVGGGTPPP